MEQQDQADLLQDIQNEVNYVDPVSPGIRFVNYLIDQIAIGVIFNGLDYVLGLTGNGNYSDDALAQGNLSIVWTRLLSSLLVTLAYYTIFEAATNGRTLGKILTNTTAITQDGTPFTFKHALMRSLCRFVPFEPFSAFGYMPWHDRWTNTVVVKKTW
ncbi:RDD family protein [Longitalea luteola]|uniref:RDD family protein n=1 Tax=Longitalea luteola TaxID=2812563 RepID=UPI001A97703D|nr:RDD family protein [Longitalea luteola]